MANYCTLTQLKAAMRIDDAVDDTLLNSSIEAASRFVDAYCERTFTKAPATATSVDYIPTGRFETLQIRDALTIVSVKIDEDIDGTFGTTLNPIDFQAEPVNSQPTGIILPFTRLTPQEDGYWPIYTGRATVRVEARYGWADVPNAVRHATVLQASRLFSRFNSPLGVAGVGDMGAIRVSRFIDPDVQLLLAPFRRLGF
jgi:hypothetical protein